MSDQHAPQRHAPAGDRQTHLTQTTGHTSLARPADEKLAQLERAFTYHPPKDDQSARYDHLRTLGKDLATAIVTITPGSREQSLALTFLETAVFWANAAIARNE